MIIVDRIENGFAVCEVNNEFINITLEIINGNLREGVVLIKTDDKYIVDEETTSQRKRELFKKQQMLFGK